MAQSPERIQEFIEALKTSQDIDAVCDLEMEYLSSHFPAATTLKRTLTRYRNVVRESFEDEEFIKKVIAKLKLSKDEYQEIKSDYRDAVYSDHLQAGNRIIDADELIIKAEELLEAPGYCKKVLGVALLTGRRPIEILNSGSFHLASDIDAAIATVEKNPEITSRENPRIATRAQVEQRIAEIGGDDVILFSGQAKQKDSADSALQPYAIPVLSDPQKILKAIEEIRELKPELANFELSEEQKLKGKNVATVINQKTSKSLNDKVTGAKHPKNFGELLPAEKCSVKHLRSAYASICWEFYGVESFGSQNLYMGLILGHSDKDLITCNSYLDFKVG